MKLRSKDILIVKEGKYVWVKIKYSKELRSDVHLIMKFYVLHKVTKIILCNSLPNSLDLVREFWDSTRG